jgi:hypothetical protein
MCIYIYTHYVHILLKDVESVIYVIYVRCPSKYIPEIWFIKCGKGV